MFVSKYSKFLTVILVILIIGILGTVGYFAYDALVIKAKNNEAKDVVDKFSRNVRRERVDSDDEEVELDKSLLDDVNSINTETVSEAQGEKVYMEGHEVIGTIKIPKTGVEYPILEDMSTRTLEIAVVKLYGVDLNQPGNATIVGHNYRNGLFFSNNSKLSKGDTIDITDQSGQTITYSIYDMFMTSPNDAEYMQRDTEGTREISLSTCNNDSSQRLIILAREKED